MMVESNEENIMGMINISDIFSSNGWNGGNEVFNHT